MNRVLVTMLLGSLAALPATALAQYPTTVWHAPYETLPGSATALSLQPPSGRTGQIELDKANGSLPFDITFNGVTYQKMRVGTKGYVTFGASSANTPSPALLTDTNPSREPKNLIAVWWGDHYCDTAAGELRSHTLGTEAAGDRRFVVEWKCTKGQGTSGDAGTGTRFRAQLVIFDLPADAPFGSNNVIRAVYGEASVDGTNDWTSLSWGQRFTMGQMGPGVSGVSECRPAATSEYPKCTSNHFPTNTVIQYGTFPTEADVSAKVEVLSFSVDSTRVNLDLKTTFTNTGMAPAPGVGFDVYLTDSPEAFNPSSAYPVGSYGTFDLAPLAVGHVEFPPQFSPAIQPAVGKYYVCIDIDPANVVPEVDKVNNRVCSRERVTVGPDLTGTITRPVAVGQAKQVVTFPLTFSNIGTVAVAGFEYTIIAVPVDNGQGTIDGEQDIYLDGYYPGTLAAGETVAVDLEIELARWLRDDAYWFRLNIDPYRLTPDADRTNNSALTAQSMSNLKPKLAMTPQPVNITFPYGCYYGQPVSATYTLCNEGQMDASGFRTGIAMGDSDGVYLTYDTPAATFPQYCGKLEKDVDSYNKQQCKPLNGIMPECPYEYCVVQCNPVDDTVCEGLGPPGLGLKCLYDYSWNELVADGKLPAAEKPYYTCQLDIKKPSPKVCRTITVTGVIPRANMREEPHEPGEKYFHVMDDIDMMLSQTEPGVSTSGPYECFESLPDFVGANLNMPERVVAGETVAVDRSIMNVGFIELGQGFLEEPETINVQYGYYLSRNRNDVSTRQIFAKVTSTDGFGVVTLGSIANGVRNVDRRPEIIQIPAEVEPGIYYIGLILDPNGEFRELDKTNNTTILDTPIVVAPPSLWIVGDPPSIVVLNSLVTYQFVAMGSVGTCRWTAESLPPGLVLNPDGLMTGRVNELGSHAYKVRATCGDLTATRAYVMQVVENRGTLAIATNELPPARTGHAYGAWIDSNKERHEGVQLVATGGVPPYTWRLVAGRPPEGLNLTMHGLITGTPTSFSETRTFTVEVKDDEGNTAQKDLTIVKVGNDTLSFNRYDLPEGETGIDYNSSCVTVSGGTPDYSWTSEGVPPGLEGTGNGSTFCVQGVPSQSGNFEVLVTASDSSNQSLSRRLPLTVVASKLSITNPALPNVSRGETVEIRLTVSGFERRPSKQVDYSLVGGSLPDGLTLSKEGVIAGTVSKDAPFGTYNFMVRAEDDWGRVGQRPFAMAVNIEAREPIVEVEKKPGCSSSGGMDLSLLGLALAGIGVFRRSRRKAEGIG